AGQKTHIRAAADQPIAVVELIDRVGRVLKIKIAVEIEEFRIEQHAAEVHSELAANALAGGALLVAEVVDRSETVAGNIGAESAAEVEVLQGRFLREAGDCERQSEYRQDPDFVRVLHNLSLSGPAWKIRRGARAPPLQLPMYGNKCRSYRWPGLGNSARRWR